MEQTEESPMLPVQSKRITLVLVYLMLYSVAMFTLPFIAFFGVRNVLFEYYSFTYYAASAWAVFAAVIVVNIIICMYAYKAYHEKEYDEDGNEIDQHSYQPMPAPANKRDSLNLKEDSEKKTD